MEKKTTCIHLWLVLALSFIHPSTTHISLPYRSSGFYLVGNETCDVQVEIFVDPFCPDCQKEYLMWKQMKPELLGVGVKLHMHAEPFHTWSFTAAVVATTCHSYDPKTTWPFLEAMWSHGAQFVPDWDDAHYTPSNLTEAGVLQQMATYATSGGLPHAVFEAGVTNRSSEGGVNPWAVTREAWKMAVSRGAASVPWYLVNRVPYYAASNGAHLGMPAWRAVLRRLLSEL